MGVDQPRNAGLGGPGCGLQFGGAENDLLPRNQAAKFKHIFQRRPYEHFEVLIVL
jgi:hypothetical protein